MQKDPQVRKQMFIHIEEWQKSKLSQKSYCSEHSISYHVFHYWYKVYRDGKSVKKQKRSSSFIKLQVEKTSSETSVHAELILADGKRLIFHEAVSSSYLKALIG
jgi:hypothetical protein